MNIILPTNEMQEIWKLQRYQCPQDVSLGTKKSILNNDLQIFIQRTRDKGNILISPPWANSVSNVKADLTLKKKASCWCSKQNNAAGHRVFPSMLAGFFHVLSEIHLQTWSLEGSRVNPILQQEPHSRRNLETHPPITTRPSGAGNTFQLTEWGVVGLDVAAAQGESRKYQFFAVETRWHFKRICSTVYRQSCEHQLFGEND